MAVVLALLIVGWLVAFALGAQAGFDAQPASKKSVTQPVATSSQNADTDYRQPVSAA
ncbi:MAG: hypothetical protein WBD47_11080 [Phormidesmis sp.]